MFDPMRLICLGGNGQVGLFNYQAKDNPDLITGTGYLYKDGKIAATHSVRAGDWWLVNFTRTGTAGVYVVAEDFTRVNNGQDFGKLVLRKADR